MDSAGLSAAIKAKMIEKFGTPTDDAELQKFCDAMGEAVVPYIQANAVVNTTGADPQGGTVVSSGTVS